MRWPVWHNAWLPGGGNDADGTGGRATMLSAAVIDSDGPWPSPSPVSQWHSVRRLTSTGTTVWPVVVGHGRNRKGTRVPGFGCVPARSGSAGGNIWTGGGSGWSPRQLRWDMPRGEGIPPHFEWEVHPERRHSMIDVSFPLRCSGVARRLPTVEVARAARHQKSLTSRAGPGWLTVLWTSGRPSHRDRLSPPLGQPSFLWTSPSKIS